MNESDVCCYERRFFLIIYLFIYLLFLFGQPESRALANYVLKHKKDIAMYISLHAYSQMWLLPWGFSEERPKDFSRLFSLAKIGATALQRVHNTSFLIGSVPDLLYRSSGSSSVPTSLLV